MDRDPRSVVEWFSPFVSRDQEELRRALAELLDFRLDDFDGAEIEPELDLVRRQAEELETALSQFRESVIGSTDLDYDDRSSRFPAWLASGRRLFASLNALVERVGTIGLTLARLPTSGAPNSQSRRKSLLSLVNLLKSRVRVLASSLGQLIANLPLPTVLEGMSFGVGVGVASMQVHLGY